MNDPLPTPDELERLPLRAVVAYAARTARRVSFALRGVVAEEILDHLLELIDAVSTTSLIVDLRRAPLANAVERLAEAYGAAPAGAKSPEKFLIVFSLVHAALAAMSALEAAVDPSSARRQMKSAAKEAQRTARQVRALDDELAGLAAEAARQDYEILLRVYGEHDEVVIGDAVDCFD
jgi:hypothetical protein